MDRGYLDYARLCTLHQAGAFFVTRAKHNMNARRVYSTKTDRTSGVICDQRIALNGYYVAKDYPEQLRRCQFRPTEGWKRIAYLWCIRFKHPASGKTLEFLTNTPACRRVHLCADRYR